MTDTTQFEDNLTGSAGALSAHAPDTINAGSASWQPSGFGSYVLTGSGGATMPVSPFYSLPNATHLHMAGTIIAAGMYIEVDMIFGRYGASGTDPAGWVIQCAAGAPEYALPPPFIKFDRATGQVSYGTTSVANTFFNGMSATFRAEVDQYAQTTKYFVNGALVATEDDSAWYLGTETWVPSEEDLNVDVYNDAGSFVVASGTDYTVVNRVEVGSLNIGGVGAARFWGDFVNSFEIDG